MRISLALAAGDESADARDVALRFGLLPANHPLFEACDDPSTDGAALARWQLSTAGPVWLESHQGGEDVQDVLLWVMSKRTGLDSVPGEFDPETPRRNATSASIITTSELFGME